MSGLHIKNFGKVHRAERLSFDILEFWHFSEGRVLLLINVSEEVPDLWGSVSAVIPARLRALSVASLSVVSMSLD